MIENETVSSWDNQIKLFAMYFLSNAKLPAKESYSLLDVGCGTGSALRIIKEKYPLAKLYGCDLEPKHVEISNTLNGDYAQFFVSNIKDLDSKWDVIYLSNVLEHIYDWKEELDGLLNKTDRLYILVPNNEELEDFPQDKSDHSLHVNSFNRNSFEYLKAGYQIDQRVISTPYAWGASPIQNLLYKIKNTKDYKSELLISITKKNVELGKPFFSFLKSLLIKYIYIVFPIYINKYLKAN